jgi:hypothetical protein
MAQPQSAVLGVRHGVLGRRTGSVPELDSFPTEVSLAAGRGAFYP